VLLVDSSKFGRRSSLILCPLERASTVITDEDVSESDARMVEQAGVRLIVAPSGAKQEEHEATSVA
jgi:DeoR family ulaG and ulaABCDEF operon transcriptional repressor